MPKRNATSELNHDNWNDEDAPEEAGTFQKATPEVIGKRVIKSARRRGVSNHSSGPSVFAGFQGFNKSASNPSPFSFLKKGSAAGEEGSDGESKSDDAAGSGATTTAATAIGNATSSSAGAAAGAEDTTTDRIAAAATASSSPGDPREPSPPYTDAYLASVKKLNECFVKHIQKYFEENQYVIFSPCFRDYEKHLKDILSFNKTSSTNVHESGKSPKPFSSTPLSVGSVGKFNIPTSSFSKENSIGGFKTVTDKDNSSIQAVGSPAGTGQSPLNTSAKIQSTWFSNFSSSTQNKFTVPSKAPAKDEAQVQSSSTEDPDDENDEPVQVKFKAVTEEGAAYSRRCKVFVKKDNSYQDHGVGMLYLKPVEEGKKTQLLVRADTSLGNVLINTLLNSDMSMQKMGNNNVMLCCVPTPDFKPAKPLPVLLRVKTSEDADELLKKMNELTK